MARDDRSAGPNPLIHAAELTPDDRGAASGEAESIQQYGEVAGRPGGGAGLGRLGLLAGVTVIAGLLWGLGRLGVDEPATGLDDDGRAAGQLGDGDDGDAGRGESGVRFSLDAGTDADAGLQPDEPESSIRVTPAQPVTPAPFVSGPVLATPTGFTLYYGGDATLQAVALDTGELSVYGIRADPVLVTGRTLIVHRAEVGLSGWVDLDDAGQQVEAWKPGRVATGPADPGLLWVLDVERDEPHPAGPEASAGVGSGRWELIDTTESRVVRRLPADLHPEPDPQPASGAAHDSLVGGVFDALHHGPSVSTRPDGVYRYDEGGYRKIVDGVVVTTDEQTGRALVGTCGLTEVRGEGGESCAFEWVDIATGQRVDWPVPSAGVRAATVAGGGRWLHSVDHAGTSELLELDTGRRLRHPWATSRPAVSPDGRWLAEWLRGVVVISDLDGGGTPITAGWVRDFTEEGQGSLVFAPTVTG